MINLTGILACDPGWRGLAFTLYIPSLQYTSTSLFRLNYTNNKAYKSPVNTIPLLVDQIINHYWKEEPRLQLVDKIIIEGQHRVNMQQLSWLIHAVLLSHLPLAKVEYISPLKCKRLFGVELGKNHKANKDRMLEYVVQHKHELIGGETVTTHDTADSIILLNTFLKEKKRRVCKNVFTAVMTSYKIQCPICANPTGAIKKCSKAPNAERYFITCANYKDGNRCGFKWLDYDEPVPIAEDDQGNKYMDADMEWLVLGEGPAPVSNPQARFSGQKRKPPPPAKRALPPAKVTPPAKGGNLDIVREVKKMHDEFMKVFPVILKEALEQFRIPLPDTANEETETAYESDE